MYLIIAYTYIYIQIEHGVLRAKSAAPSLHVFGAFAVSPVTFYGTYHHYDYYVIYMYLLISLFHFIFVGYVCMYVYVYIDRDPRRDFVLKQPKPFVTFFLFTANPLTTPLSVLRDAESLDEELEIYARQYIQRTVIFDSDKRQLLIPEIFRVYLKDFGESTEKMILRILKLHTNEFKEMLSTVKWKSSFYPIDWSPVLIF